MTQATEGQNLRMRMPTALRSLDDRVLGDRGKSRRRPDSEAPREQHDEHEPYPEETTERETTRETGPRRGSTGDGLKQFLSVFTQVARAVFLLLALIVILGIVFILAPTNSDNVIVDNVLDVADSVAGPFRDVFTADDAEREMVINYGLAAGVYFLAAALVRKLAPSTT